MKNILKTLIMIILATCSGMQARTIIVQISNAPQKSHRVTLDFYPNTYKQIKRANPQWQFQRPGVQIDQEGVFTFVFENVPNEEGFLSLQRIDSKKRIYNMRKKKGITKFFTSNYSQSIPAGEENIVIEIDSDEIQFGTGFMSVG